MALAERMRAWARKMKCDAVTLWFGCRHADTPVMVKLLCVLVVAYALSPVDLIPDFIPILGYLDEALLLPCLIWIAIKLMPSAVLDECRGKAIEWMAREGRQPRSRWGVLLVASVWILALWAGWTYLLQACF
ncbi:YkvA family protein [Massilia niastensis]|uniref:YkvA family protein n=1 Tax=Massilia niastensis TaxID=544911 RepID=UPI00037B600C|nr:YkvA family protein [Massilia niastensis]